MLDSEPSSNLTPAGGRQDSPKGGLEDALQHYLSLIDRHPLLSAEEERQLATSYKKTRAPALARRLVLANLRFVVKIAFEYRSHPVRMLDLVQEGNLGLITAVQRFDPARGVRLNTYSVWWIRAFIQEHIRRSISIVRFGTTRAEQRCLYRLRRERALLAQRSNKGLADQKALADVLGVTEKDLVIIEARLTHNDVSLDSSDLLHRTGVLPDGIHDTHPGPEALIAELEYAAVTSTSIQAALARLDPREQTIIRARYLSNEKSTLQKLGEDLGISRERVRQLELRAKAKMRKRLSDLPLSYVGRLRRRRAPRSRTTTEG